MIFHNQSKRCISILSKIKEWRWGNSENDRMRKEEIFWIDCQRWIFHSFSMFRKEFLVQRSGHLHWSSNWYGHQRTIFLEWQCFSLNSECFLWSSMVKNKMHSRKVLIISYHFCFLIERILSKTSIWILIYN